MRYRNCNSKNIVVIIIHYKSIFTDKKWGTQIPHHNFWVFTDTWVVGGSHFFSWIPDFLQQCLGFVSKISGNLAQFMNLRIVENCGLEFRNLTFFFFFFHECRPNTHRNTLYINSSCCVPCCIVYMLSDMQLFIMVSVVAFRSTCMCGSKCLLFYLLIKLTVSAYNCWTRIVSSFEWG